MLQALRRWRTSRGHGVHSPFAFRLITGVLRTSYHRYAYYGYETLLEIAGGRRRFRHLALVFRLICRFRPRTVLFLGTMDLGVAEAVALADSHLSVNGEIPDFLYVLEGGPGITEILERVLALEGNVVVLHKASPQMVEFVRERLAHGMTFSNRRDETIVAVCRHDLTRRDYKLYF